MKVSIIGTGNLGTHLCKAFGNAEVEVHQVCGRSIPKAEAVAKFCNATPIDSIKLLDAEIVIIAVSDDYIDDICRELPKNIKDNAIVVHTSGSRYLDALEGCKQQGVFYPLNTFSKNIALNFSNTPILLNGTPEIVNTLRPLANAISDNVSFMSDKDRRQTHLSAVVICNFTNHLIYLAKERLEKMDIDSEVLEPLLLETIRKQDLFNPYDAQTGPARRNDQETLDKHLHILKEEKQLYDVYKTISKSITKTYE